MIRLYGLVAVATVIHLFSLSFYQLYICQWKLRQVWKINSMFNVFSYVCSNKLQKKMKVEKNVFDLKSARLQFVDAKRFYASLVRISCTGGGCCAIIRSGSTVAKASRETDYGEFPKMRKLRHKVNKRELEAPKWLEQMSRNRVATSRQNQFCSCITAVSCKSSSDLLEIKFFCGGFPLRVGSDSIQLPI